MEPWQVAIITTAVGGVFALLGGWLGIKWGKNAEHEQWLRNELISAYTEFMKVYGQLSFRVDEAEATGEIPDQRQIIKLHECRLVLLASTRVGACYSELEKSLEARLRAVQAGDSMRYRPLLDRENYARGKLADAIKRDLGVEWKNWIP